VSGEAEAVRLVEDVIDAHYTPCAGCAALWDGVPAGPAIVAALIEAGWVAPYSIPEPTEPDARVLDRAGDTWERVPSGAWRLYCGHTPHTWAWLVETWGPLRLAPPKAVQS
jgi:hypothetical protein